MIWFPRTKLQWPTIGPDVLQRPALAGALLQAVNSKRLTLICAQAGAGKTTLIASLPTADPAPHGVWITLDETDNDLTTFLSLLLAAIGEFLPGCKFDSQSLLAAQPEAPADPRRLIGLLINDILTCNPDPFVLVLDDLHLIDNPTILAALDYLLEHLPFMMHIVISTRQDPPLALSRLRARGQLAEFRMQRLRFNESETAQLLHDLLGIDAARRTLEILQQRTEGWVTALRLLTLSLETLSPDERSAFVDQMAHSQQFIFDYLVDEVLRRQTDATRQFLLKSALLGEMTPSLCRALTGQADAAAILDDLFRRNLFVTRNESDQGEPIYRYHALFRQFLQVQLRQTRPASLPGLHLRAGTTLGVAWSAVPHFVAAEAWEQAADLLEKLAKDHLEAGYVQPQIEGWINALPPSTIDSRPWLQLVCGRIQVQGGHLSAGQPYLDAALAAFRAADDRRGQLQVLIFLTQSAPGVHPQIMAELNELMAEDPGLARPWERTACIVAGFWQGVYQPDWEMADRSLLALVDLAQRQDDPISYSIIAQMITPPMLFTPSGLPPFDRLALNMAKHARDNILIRAGHVNLLALLATLRGNLADAAELIPQAGQIVEQIGEFGWLTLTPRWLKAVSLRAKGEYEALARHIGSSLDALHAAETQDSRRSDLLYNQAWLAWQQSQVDALKSLVSEMQEITYFPDQEVSMLLVAAMGAAATDKSEEAEKLARKAIERVAITRQILTSEPRLILAQILWRGGKKRAALRALGPALADLRARDMAGIVLMEGPALAPLLQAALASNVETDFAQQCLDRLSVPSAPRSLAIPGSAESLTPREAEVLQLIVQGAGNREIADTLIITERTVKSHVTKILAKLDVSSRTQATARARELKLLP